ncbi:MAG: hypothetical protein JXO51_06635 [Candidatus Aminicenantes bacterium]|nr:hypothetical protein [Candidatus Aminicenantes bacterium]
MRIRSLPLLLLWLAACPLAQRAGGWEWQFAAGPWTLAPLTSPVERLAERIVADEARRLLAPLLSDFTVIAYEPGVEMDSRGFFISAGCWRLLGDGPFALGASLSYLGFTLPFSLEDERVITLQDIPLARIRTRGRGEIDLRTFMLTAQGRWRAFRSGRFALHAGLGLSILRLEGRLALPLTASVQTFLGTIELEKTEEATLAELRRDGADVPSWSLAPSLSAALFYRLSRGSRFFLEIGLSQGTFLAAGLSLGR